MITNGLKKYGTWTAIILSAVFFALIHQNLQQLIYQLFLGGVMAYIVIKTGNIVYTMILHFFNNFVILLSAYLTGSTTNNIDYSNAWNVIYPILLVIAAVGAIIGLLILVNYILKRSKQPKVEAVQSEQPKTENLQAEIVAEENIKISDAQKEANAGQSEEVKSEVNSAQSDIFADDKFYKNIYMLFAVVGGIVFWIFAVISSFQ